MRFVGRVLGCTYIRPGRLRSAAPDRGRGAYVALEGFRYESLQYLFFKLNPKDNRTNTIEQNIKRLHFLRGESRAVHTQHITGPATSGAAAADRCGGFVDSCRSLFFLCLLFCVFCLKFERLDCFLVGLRLWPQFAAAAALMLQQQLTDQRQFNVRVYTQL